VSSSAKPPTRIPEEHKPNKAERNRKGIRAVHEPDRAQRSRDEMKFRVPGYPSEFDVELTDSGDHSITARINGDQQIVTIVDSSAAGAEIIRIGRRAARVFSIRQRDAILVATGPVQFEFIAVETRSPRRMHGLVTPEITAPMPGKVVKLPVTEGQQVESGDVLVVLEAMKMETALHAESPAMVNQIRTSVGQMVDHGTVLLVLSPATSQSKPGADPQAP
jgi:acetyl/propionyl-CoA carboxylase alpha subunit